LKDGRLYPILPRVYAVGHRAVPIEGRLVAAILYAGPGAALSHATAAWWWGLLPNAPEDIHVSSPNRPRTRPGVVVHHPQRQTIVHHRRLPVTTVPQTLLDLASRPPDLTVRRALAEAEYRGLLDIPAVRAELRQGRAGAARLRRALEGHEPQLARTRSEFEVRFLELCRTADVPMPKLNLKVEGHTVDALWRAQRVAVELDGFPGHHTRAQIERDRRRDLDLRRAGFLVLRYTWAQLDREPALVVADLRAALELRSDGPDNARRIK
jgi:very-short-patch-repair endonuclease